MAKLLVLKTFIDKKNDAKLRMPGSVYEDSQSRGEALAKNSFVKIVEADKQDKALKPEVETKEAPKKKTRKKKS